MIRLFNQHLKALAGDAFSGDFIKWLRGFVEAFNDAAALAATAEANAEASLAAICPTGSVMAFAGSAAPTGWVLCDGTSYARTGAKAALFAAIGTAWGAVDGSHFNVPDLRGRALIGVGTGTGLTARALAATGGEETHQLTTAELASHAHTAGSLAADSNGAHQHGLSQIVSSTPGSVTGFGAINSSPGRTSITAQTDSAGAHTHTISGSTASNGSGTAHNNMQPFAAVNWIIKL